MRTGTDVPGNPDTTWMPRTVRANFARLDGTRPRRLDWFVTTRTSRNSETSSAILGLRCCQERIPSTVLRSPSSLGRKRNQLARWHIKKTERGEAKPRDHCCILCATDSIAGMRQPLRQPSKRAEGPLQ